MTDNPLVEAVALAISNSTKQLTIEELAKHTCTKAANGASGLSVIEATAALHAIEDAGWKVVKADQAMQSTKSPYASPDLANAPVADRRL